MYRLEYIFILISALFVVCEPEVEDGIMTSIHRDSSNNNGTEIDNMNTVRGRYDANRCTLGLLLSFHNHVKILRVAEELAEGRVILSSLARKVNTQSASITKLENVIEDIIRYCTSSFYHRNILLAQCICLQIIVTQHCICMYDATPGLFSN